MNTHGSLPGLMSQDSLAATAMNPTTQLEVVNMNKATESTVDHNEII